MAMLFLCNVTLSFIYFAGTETPHLDVCLDVDIWHMSSIPNFAIDIRSTKVSESKTTEGYVQSFCSQWHSQSKQCHCHSFCHFMCAQLQNMHKCRIMPICLVVLKRLTFSFVSIEPDPSSLVQVAKKMPSCVSLTWRQMIPWLCHTPTGLFSLTSHFYAKLCCHNYSSTHLIGKSMQDNMHEALQARCFVNSAPIISLYNCLPIQAWYINPPSLP